MLFLKDIQSEYQKHTLAAEEIFRPLHRQSAITPKPNRVNTTLT